MLLYVIKIKPHRSSVVKSRGFQSITPMTWHRLMEDILFGFVLISHVPQLSFTNTHIRVSYFYVFSRCPDPLYSSPPPSSPQMDPSALEPGHLWGQTGRCSPRSNWPEPPVHRHCSRGMSHGRTCWTSEKGRIAHTYLLSLAPYSYLYIVRDIKYKQNVATFLFQV